MKILYRCTSTKADLPYLERGVSELSLDLFSKLASRECFNKWEIVIEFPLEDNPYLAETDPGRVMAAFTEVSKETAIEMLEMFIDAPRWIALTKDLSDTDIVSLSNPTFWLMSNKVVIKKEILKPEVITLLRLCNNDMRIVFEYMSKR